VLFPIRFSPFETLRDWECFNADTGNDSARENREYFTPRLQQLEEPRLLSGRLPAPDQRPESVRLQSQIAQTARPWRHARDLANRPFGSFPIWNPFVFQNFEKNL